VANFGGMGSDKRVRKKSRKKQAWTAKESVGRRPNVQKCETTKAGPKSSFGQGVECIKAQRNLKKFVHYGRGVPYKKGGGPKWERRF